MDVNVERKNNPTLSEHIMSVDSYIPGCSTRMHVAEIHCGSEQLTLTLSHFCLIRGHKEEKVCSRKICVKGVDPSVNRWPHAAGLDGEQGYNTSAVQPLK